MIPGITVGRVEHAYDSTVFGYGKASTNTARNYQGIATNGSGTFGIISHISATASDTTVNVYYSTNYGRTWTQVSGTVPTRITCIAYLDNQWVVGLGNSQVRYTSDITSAWSSWSTSGSSVGTTQFYNYIHYVPGTNLGATKWIFADTGANTWRYTSALGAAWTTAAANLTNMQEIVSGKLSGDVTIYLRPGDIGKVTSSSLTTLSLAATPMSGNNRCLVYHAEKDVWVVGGTTGALASSPGSGSTFTWTSRTASGETATFQRMVSIPGIGIIACTAPVANTAQTNEQGKIWFSEDGTSWSLISIATESTRAYGYGFGGVGANDGAYMVRSESALGTFPHSANDAMNFKFILPADR